MRNSIQRAGIHVKRGGRMAFNRVGNSNKTDWGKWLKTILVIISGVFLIIAVIKFGKKIMKFLGLDKGAVDGQSGFDSTSAGSALNSLTGNVDGLSGGGGANGSSGGTSNKNKPWRTLVDSIYDHLNDANLFTYPEVVNKLAHLPPEQVKYACYYWANTYKSGTKKSLVGFIKGEWSAEATFGIGGAYEPAIGALAKTGIYNKEIKKFGLSGVAVSGAGWIAGLLGGS